MNTEKYVITPEGLVDLKSELERLRSIRLPKISEELKQARNIGVGHIEDDADIEETLKVHAFVTGRIMNLENIVSRAKIVKSNNCKEKIVGIGTRVTVRYVDGTVEIYRVVGSAEVNRIRGQISNDSPVGQALIGKKESDKVEVIVPSGTAKLEIIAIN